MHRFGSPGFCSHTACKMSTPSSATTLGCQTLVTTSEWRDAKNRAFSSSLLTSNICRPGILAKVSTAMALDDTIWFVEKIWWNKNSIWHLLIKSFRQRPVRLITALQRDISWRSLKLPHEQIVVLGVLLLAFPRPLHGEWQLAGTGF